MYTKSPTKSGLEQSSISQFDSWAKNWGLKRNWQFFFSNKAILNSVHLNNGISILDVGCASGVLLRQMSQQMAGLDLNGLDISIQMVKLAEKRLGKSAKIKEGSANKLPYKNSTFDLITCATSFHHYPDSQRAINEMYRVLKPEGKLILLDPFTNGFLRKTICQILDILFQEKGTHLFKQEEMRNMFVKAGFQQIKQKQYLFYKLITIGMSSPPFVKTIFWEM